MLHFTDDRGATVALAPEAFIIAGYTGRDRAMVQKHIDELAHEGIAPPPEVPMWYEMPPAILTTSDAIETASPQSCGECEPVIIGIGDALYLGIGSDHTARDVEREDIKKSKAVCPKPIGTSLVRVDAFGSDFDAVTIESWIDGEPYQSGTFAQITALATLLDGFKSRKNVRSFALFCGTVPLLTHGFRFGTKFSATISGGPLAAPITLDYTTTLGK
jgi:4-hydroxyphenylacetate 3-monooxygenase